MAGPIDPITEMIMRLMASGNAGGLPMQPSRGLQGHLNARLNGFPAPQVNNVVPGPGSNPPISQDPWFDDLGLPKEGEGYAETGWSSGVTQGNEDKLYVFGHDGAGNRGGNPLDGPFNSIEEANAARDRIEASGRFGGRVSVGRPMDPGSQFADEGRLPPNEFQNAGEISPEDMMTSGTRQIPPAGDGEFYIWANQNGKKIRVDGPFTDQLQAMREFKLMQKQDPDLLTRMGAYVGGPDGE